MLSDEFCWNFCCSAKVIQRFKFLAREHKQATQIAALSQAWRDVLADPHYMERRHFQFRFHKGETAFNVTFSLVLSIVSLILVNRSFSASLVAAFRRPNPALAWITLAITVILSLTLLWPPISALFQFGPLHIDDLALTIFGGAFVLLVLRGAKAFMAPTTGFLKGTHKRGAAGQCLLWVRSGHTQCKRPCPLRAKSGH